AGEADAVVLLGQLDRVDGAGFFAHAAVDAAQLIDVELRGVFLPVGPRALGRLDVDAARRAGGGAHEAGDALDSPFLVLVQAVDAAVGAQEHAALFDGDVLAALLGILDDAILPAEHLEHVLRRGSQAR